MGTGFVSHPGQKSGACATRVASATALLFLTACTVLQPPDPTLAHLTDHGLKPQPAGDIPPPVEYSLAALPQPRPGTQAEIYSVVVNNVAVRDLLFALARNARLNVDIHPGIEGAVSLNAVDQTLPQLLSRIAKQVDMRFELDGSNLAVMPDAPYLAHYRVDYVNVARNVTGAVSANTQIATAPGTTAPSPQGGGNNLSSTRIEHSSKNLFWESLERNIKDLLRETDKILPDGSSETVVEQAASQNASGAAALPHATGKVAVTMANALASNPAANSTSQSSGSTVVRRTTFREAASVIVHPESGIVTVRATQRQHDKIREFIDQVLQAARRQVMIEATIVEVQLGNGYEQGIDWSRMIGSGTFALTAAAANASTAPAFSPFKLTYAGNTVTSAIRLLESFGTAKVLSSPRLSVLNNQTAILKVVENVVYFNVKADTTATANVGTTTAVTTTPQSVSVGLVMTVTAQVGDNDMIILNVRPTISSISAFKRDPNPSIPATIENLVPQIRTREIESVMRLGNGDIAVLGGLMEDGIDYKTGRLPILGQAPLAGELVTARSNAIHKSELVIFLRPLVIRDASLAGDYTALRNFLPGQAFLPPSTVQP